MDDLFRFAIFWVKQHPLLIVGGLVAFLLANFLLTRKSAKDREAERVVRNLVEGSRDKYRDGHPLT